MQRGISEPPADIRRILDLVNLLPKDRKTETLAEEVFSGYSSRSEKILTLAKERNDFNFVADIEAEADNCLSEVRMLFGEELVKALNFGRGGMSYLKIHHNYRIALEYREVLRSLVQQVTSVHDFHFGNQLVLPGVSTSFFLTEDGRLEQQSSSELISILTSESVQVTRLGQCPICENFYWAKREGAPTCSTGCANTYHQRRFQARKRIDRLERRLEALEKSLNQGRRNRIGKPELTEKTESLRAQIEEEKAKGFINE